MASLESILLAGKGTAGAWRVSGEHPGHTDIVVKHLWHYSTLMLTWREDMPADENYLDYSTGWGSVSDQGGMNKAFRILGIPRYFVRRGGAEIVETDAVNAQYIAENSRDLLERWGRS